MPLDRDHSQSRLDEGKEGAFFRFKDKADHQRPGSLLIKNRKQDDFFSGKGLRVMRMIMFLLGLFAIVCVLYGISAGVQTIQRGLTRLLNNGRNDEATEALPAPVTLETTESVNAKEAAPSCQGYIGELRELYELHKQGALTKEEFQDWKRHLLSAMHSMSSVRRSGHFRDIP